MDAPARETRGTPGSDCVARLARGDAAALAEVYAAFSVEVHRVAFAITLSPDDADDVVQDVCRSARRRAELTPESASTGDGSQALVERLALEAALAITQAVALQQK